MTTAHTGHVRTDAIAVRAGEAITLVALPAWRDGQILAPVATALLLQITGLRRQHLPGTRLTVAAYRTRSWTPTWTCTPGTTIPPTTGRQPDPARP